MSLITLTEKRDNLLQDNMRLRTELDNKTHNSKVNDIIESIKKYQGPRGGKYNDIINLPEYETKWKGTFFDTQRPLIEQLKAYPINRLELYKEGYSNNPFTPNIYVDLPGELIGHCDMVAPSKYGPVIRITDPYGSVTFPPLKKTPYETAINWLGRILLVEALYKYERKNPIVTRVQVLMFTLHEDLRNIS